MNCFLSCKIMKLLKLNISTVHSLLLRRSNDKFSILKFLFVLLYKKKEGILLLVHMQFVNFSFFFNFQNNFCRKTKKYLVEILHFDNGNKNNSFLQIKILQNL